MAFSLMKILKGILIREEASLTPRQIAITPGGSTGTTTTVVSSQTSDVTVTLPNATDTIVARNTSDTLTNKTIVVAANTVTTLPSGNLIATELNAALAELEAEITETASDLQNHINDPTDAHDASAISVIPSGNLIATDVQNALEDLQDLADTTDSDLVSHIADTSTHGISGDIVGTTDNQTLSNKTFTNQTTLADFLVAVEQLSVGTTPSAGQRLLYAKNDGFYQKDSLGVETQIGSGNGAINVITDNFIGDGVETNFTLSDTPGSQSNMFVFIQGVEQEQSTFSVSGTTLILTSPLPNLITMEVKYGVSLDIGEPSDDTISFAKLKQEVLESLNPVGSIMIWPISTPPPGYLSCDGTAVSRTTYSALFTKLGITHGQGDGSSTFNLPDYRGRFLRGVDGLAGNDPDKLSRTAMNSGGNTGNDVGSIQGDMFSSHTHIQDPHNHSIQTGNTGSGIASGFSQVSTSSTANTTATNQNTGGNETRPKNAYVNFVIKV